MYAGSAYNADEVRLKADGVEANIPEEWEGTVRCGGLWIDEVRIRLGAHIDFGAFLMALTSQTYRRGLRYS